MLSLQSAVTVLLISQVLSAPPKLLFSADFDGSPKPMVGQGEAIVSGGQLQFLEGKRGQALLADGSAVLAYPAKGNLVKTQGTVCLWVCPRWDGDDGKNHGLFADDLPFHDKPQNTLYLWKWMAGSVLRLDLRSEADQYLTYSVADWRAGEWHHVAAAWDSKEGNRLFIDGRFVAARGGRFEPKMGMKFFVGADWQGGSPADALLDELRIYDVPLTAGQVQRVLQGLAIPELRAVALTAPTRIMPGQPFHVTLTAEAASTATSLEPQAFLESLPLVRVSPRGAQALETGRNTWHCEFLLPGWYRLPPGHKAFSVTIDGAHVEKSEVWHKMVQVDTPGGRARPPEFTMAPDGTVLRDGKIYLAERKGQAFWFDGAVQPYDQAGRTLCERLVKSGRIVDVIPCRLVDRVECTATDHEFHQWGESKVVTLVDGRQYRVTGTPESVTETRESYGAQRRVLPAFAYRLACRPRATPHLLVVESINDRERYLETAIDAAPEAEPSPLLMSGGLGHTDLINLHVTYTGREYPCDGQSFQQVTLFFPKSAAVDVTLASSSREREKTDTSGGAAASLAIYEIEAELADLGVTVNPPAGEQRTISLFYPWESPLYEEYGSTRATPTTRQASVTCMMEYLRFMGFNRLEFHPYHFDRSACFASKIFPQSGDADVFEDVLPIAQRHNVEVVPRVDSLVFYLSGKGAEEYEKMPDIYQLTCRGETMDFFGTVPDPLHPVVQQLMYDLLREMAEKTRDWSCVPAVGFRANGKFGNLYVGTNRKHPPEESGYSEFDIAEFQKNTGVIVGGTAGDPAQRYEWLRANVWDQWIEWRCRRIHEHWRHCLEAVREADPRKHLIVFTKIPSNDPGEKRDWEKAPVDLLELHRYHGYDPALYKNEEGLVLSRVMGIDADRYWPEEWNKRFFFEPPLSGFFRSGEPSGVELYYIYWELPTHPKGFRVGPGAPLGRAYYEPITHAIRLQNPGHFTFYNWFRATMGHEQDLREFCRAFRGLPMTEPQSFEGEVLPAEAASDETLWIRQFGDRIAVVNDSGQPRTVSLILPRGYAEKGLRDLALNEDCATRVEGGRRTVSLNLRAWDLRTLAPVRGK